MCKFAYLYEHAYYTFTQNKKIRIPSIFRIFSWIIAGFSKIIYLTLINLGIVIRLLQAPWLVSIFSPFTN